MILEPLNYTAVRRQYMDRKIVIEMSVSGETKVKNIRDKVDSYILPRFAEFVQTRIL